MAVGDSTAGEKGKESRKRGEEGERGCSRSDDAAGGDGESREREPESLHCAHDFICLSLYFVTSPREG